MRARRTELEQRAAAVERWRAPEPPREPPPLHKVERRDKKTRPNPWGYALRRHRANQQRRLARAAVMAGLSSAGAIEQCGKPQAVAFARRTDGALWPSHLARPGDAMLEQLARRELVPVLSRPPGEPGVVRSLVNRCNSRHCLEGCGATHAAKARARLRERIEALLEDDTTTIGDLLGDLAVQRPTAKAPFIAPALLDDDGQAALGDILAAMDAPHTTADGAREAEAIVASRTGLAPRQRMPTYLYETAQREAALEREVWAKRKAERRSADRSDDAEWKARIRAEHAAELAPALDELRASRGRLYRGEVRLHQHDPEGNVWEWRRLTMRHREMQHRTFTRPKLDGEPLVFGFAHLEKAISVFLRIPEVRRRVYATMWGVEPEFSTPSKRQRRVTSLMAEAQSLEADAYRVQEEEGDLETGRALHVDAQALRREAASMSSRLASDGGSWWHVHAHAALWIHGGWFDHDRMLTMWRGAIASAYLTLAEQLEAKAERLLLPLDNAAAVVEIRNVAAHKAARLRVLAKGDVTRYGLRGLPKTRFATRAILDWAAEIEGLAEDQARALEREVWSTTTAKLREDAARELFRFAAHYRAEAEKPGRGGVNIGRRRGHPAEVVHEVVKYATKMSAARAEMPLAQLAELLTATRGRRLMRTSGLLYGVKLDDDEHAPGIELEGGALDVIEGDDGAGKAEVLGWTPDGEAVVEDDVVWLSDGFAAAVRLELLRVGWDHAVETKRELMRCEAARCRIRRAGSA